MLLIGVQAHMSELVLGVLVGLLSAAFFAIQNVLIKGQTEGVGALISNSVKMWVSLLLMVSLVIVPWRSHEFLLPLSALFPLAISILLGGAFGDAAYLISQERIGVSRAFPIANTFPIITYLFALLFLDEVLRISTVSGIILTIGGIILISRELVTEDLVEQPKSYGWKGLALALMSSIMFAFATIFMEIGVTSIDPIDANLFRMMIGSMAMVPIFSISYRTRIKPLSKKAVQVVAIAGFFGMGFASLLYVFSIKLVGATVGAVIGSTSPLFALPISILYLKERITWWGVLGTIATILGIWLVVVGV